MCDKCTQAVLVLDWETAPSGLPVVPLLATLGSEWTRPGHLGLCQMGPADESAPTYIIPAEQPCYLFSSVTAIKAPHKLEATGDSSSGQPSYSSWAQVLEKQVILRLLSPGTPARYRPSVTALEHTAFSASHFVLCLNLPFAHSNMCFLSGAGGP